MSFKLKQMIAGAAILAATAVAGQADDVKLKIASTTLENQPAFEHLTQMIKDIEGAGVNLSVDFFPAGQLGSGEELLEDAKFGNVDIVHAAIYAQADQRLEFMSLPFMITTLDDIQAIMSNPDSEYNKILTGILADHGLQHLATIGEGLIGVVASKTPADVDGTGNQEMNLRVWSSQLVKSTMEVLGYQTTTMAWAEVFPAVQAGTIDGAICCTSELAFSLFAESDVGNTFIPYNAFVETNVIYVNAAKWNKLSAEQQAAIQAAATKAATGINDSSWNRNEEFLAKLRDKNWDVVDFSDEERAKFKALIAEKVWPSVGDLVGKDILDKLTGN